MAQYDVDLRDYWRILKKRKAAVVLMVILAGISSYGFAKLKEPIPLYEAVSSVKIERVTNMADLLMGGFWYQGENMVTQAFIIKSFPVLVQTAKELNRLPGDLSIDRVRNTRSNLAVIERLKSMVKTEQEQGTNIINISAVSKDPQEAADVANAFATAYRDFNIQEKNKQTFETKTFIEEQLEVTSKNLNRVEEAYRAFKESTELVALDFQTQKKIGILSSIESKYDNARRKKEEIEHQIQLIEKTESTPENLDGVFFPEETSTIFHTLSTQFHTLVMKKNALLFDYTEDHPEVIEINAAIQGVIEQLKKELYALLRTYQTRETELFNSLQEIRKENRSLPEKALQLARLSREVKLQEVLYSQLKTKYQETLIKESGKVEEVTIVRPAMVPTNPINIPSKLMIIVTGTIMGLIIGIVFTFVLETLDTSIGTIEDVESLLNVPVLGVIPYWGEDEKNHGERDSSDRVRARSLITHYDPKSLAAEAFRSLRTNIQFTSQKQKGKTFLITSSFVQEGKTSNVVNISLSMAQAGDRVLLVEGDLRKPLIHKMFGISKTPGLTDYVLGNYQWKEVVISLTDIMLGDFEIEDILKTPGLDNLNIMTAGTNPPNPSEILRSPRLRQFLKEAYEEYNYIFLDAPPILPVADATEIAPLTDAVILVYKVGAIGRGILNRAKLTLDNVNAKVMGVILNNVKPEIGPDYFKYHAHYYYGPPKDAEPDRDTTFLKSPNLIMFILALALLILGIFWKNFFPL